MLVVFPQPGGAVVTDRQLDGRNGFKLANPSASRRIGDVRGGGDFNGDGLGDLVLTYSDGSAAMVFGRRTASSPFPALLGSGRVAAVLVRPLGYSVNSGRRVIFAQLVGDTTGDGRAELLVGGCTFPAAGRPTCGLDLVMGRPVAPTMAIDLLPAPSQRVAFSVPSGVYPTVGPQSAIGDVGGDARGDWAVLLPPLGGAVVFGGVESASPIDLSNLPAGAGFVTGGEVGGILPIGRFTGGPKDDLILVGGQDSQIAQVFRGRAVAPASPVGLDAPGGLWGPRFEIDPITCRRPFRLLPGFTSLLGNPLAIAELNGDTAPELVIACLDSEGRAPGSGIAMVIPGFGVAWADQTYRLDYSDAMPKLFVTAENRELRFSAAPHIPDRADGVAYAANVGDLDGDGVPEIMVSPDLAVRGRALR
jgi:hypothetical protein